MRKWNILGPEIRSVFGRLHINLRRERYYNIKFNYMVISGVDPESGNRGPSHFKRLFIRDETELEINR
jgi:hypothetical protein